MTSPTPQEYYQRQLILSGFGHLAQKKLQESTVLVVGAGGLGCPALQYIAGAGVGNIIIADGDNIQISNLHRQILYTQDDIGKNKAEVAASRISKLNPLINVTPITQNITSDNIEAIIHRADVIIDSTDSFETRFLLGKYSYKNNIPLVYAAIYEFEAQLTVFNYNNEIAFEDLFPTMPGLDATPNCATNGVIGFVPGFIGIAQAAEAIKIITNIGPVNSGKLLLIDLLTLNKKEIKLTKQIKQAEKPKEENNLTIHSISANELKQRIDNNDLKLFILDVREPWEYKAFNIGGTLIPLSELADRVHEIPTGKDIVICCKMGVRSLNAAMFIKEVIPELNIYNLHGGLLSWNS